jgi:ubiquitin-conjugating enzyme E2 M
VAPLFSPSSSTPTILTNPPRSSARKRCVSTGLSSGIFLIRPQIYHPNVDLDGNVCLNILREDWKPVLNLNSVMVGLQYLFLEPNADDPLNKGEAFGYKLPTFSDPTLLSPTEAAEDLRRGRDKFVYNVKSSLRGGNVNGTIYDNVSVN